MYISMCIRILVRALVSWHTLVSWHFIFNMKTNMARGVGRPIPEARS
jgi:hypothetical protein